MNETTIETINFDTNTRTTYTAYEVEGRGWNVRLGDGPALLSCNKVDAAAAGSALRRLVAADTDKPNPMRTRNGPGAWEADNRDW